MIDDVKFIKFGHILFHIDFIGLIRPYYVEDVIKGYTVITKDGKENRYYEWEDGFQEVENFYHELYK